MGARCSGPLGRTASENATRTSKRAILSSVAKNSFNTRKRVLVVEDEADIREMLSGVLNEEGYEVLSAVHGQDALNKLERGFNPNVILLDLMMPVLNGFELLRVLYRTPRWSSIPVVIVTASQGWDAIDLGSSAIIPKPFDLDVLLLTLRRLLAVSAATAQGTKRLPRRGPAGRFEPAVPPCAPRRPSR